MIAHDLGNVTIEIRPFTSTSPSRWVAEDDGRSGQETIDLAIVTHEWLALLKQRGLIEELPAERAQILREKLNGRAFLAAGDGERVFAYPIGAEVLALVYDPALFPTPPQSLEAILSARLPAGVLPFALDVSRVRALAPFVSSLQGRLLDDRGYLLWGPAAAADVFARLEPLWRMDGGWDVCREADLESLQVQLFAEGKLASFVAGPWLVKALEATGRPFAVAPLPGLAGVERPARALVTYDCAVVLRGSRWADLALEVGARLLMEGPNARLNGAAGRLPVLTGDHRSDGNPPSSPEAGFMRALEAGQAVPFASHWAESVGEAEARLMRLATATQWPAPQQVRKALAGSAP